MKQIPKLHSKQFQLFIILQFHIKILHLQILRLRAWILDLNSISANY